MSRIYSAPDVPLTPLAFGIEIEFVLLYVVGDAEDPEGHLDWELAPLLRLSESEQRDPERCIDNKIREAFEKYIVPQQPGIDARYGWVTTGDFSITETPSVGYQYVAVEIQSPILWANEGAFYHLSHVFSVLTRCFRMRINSSCGFHVHVSKGVDRHFTQTDLRRLAALCWASDNALSRFHPPERRYNNYCRSIRDESPLARSITGLGNGNAPAKRRNPSPDSEFGDPSITEAPPMATSRRQNWDDARRPTVDRDQKRLPILPLNPNKDSSAIWRLVHPWTFAGSSIEENRKDYGDLPEPTVSTVYGGVNKIMAAQDREAVALLLAGGRIFSQRLNWNFMAWTTRNRKRQTVECRAAQSTLNAGTISFWCRIVVGVAQFAIDADDQKYWDVIDRLSVAEAQQRFGSDPNSLGPDAERIDPGVKERMAKVGLPEKGFQYDVMDFLEDIGLYAESHWFEHHIRPDPDKFWFPHHPMFPRPPRSRGSSQSSSEDDVPEPPPGKRYPFPLCQARPVGGFMGYAKNPLRKDQEGLYSEAGRPWVNIERAPVIDLLGDISSAESGDENYMLGVLHSSSSSSTRSAPRSPITLTVKSPLTSPDTSADVFGIINGTSNAQAPRPPSPSVGGSRIAALSLSLPLILPEATTTGTGEGTRDLSTLLGGEALPEPTLPLIPDLVPITVSGGGSQAPLSAIPRRLHGSLRIRVRAPPTSDPRTGDDIQPEDTFGSLQSELAAAGYGGSDSDSGDSPGSTSSRRTRRASQ